MDKGTERNKDRDHFRRNWRGYCTRQWKRRETWTRVMSPCTWGTGHATNCSEVCIVPQTVSAETLWGELCCVADLADQNPPLICHMFYSLCRYVRGVRVQMCLTPPEKGQLPLTGAKPPHSLVFSSLPTEMHAVCGEPPAVPHSARTGDTCPYYLHDQISYTCDACYTGGGNITCLATGRWSRNVTCEGTYMCCLS